MSTIAARRPILAMVLAGIIGTTVSIAAVSYAQQGTSPRPPASATPSSPIATSIRHALDDLVGNRTITRAQADTVQAQADAGSINPKTLVQSGALTDNQMHTVAYAIYRIKQANRP
jgi:hypothetical protein